MTVSKLLSDGSRPTIDDRDETITDLRAEIYKLQSKLETARMELDEVRAELIKRESMMQAVHDFQRLTDPFYLALQLARGVAERIPEPGNATPGPRPVANSRWELWKQRLKGRPAEIIDLLVVNGSMSVRNLMTAMHCGQDAVYSAVKKLQAAGVTENHNGKYSLREL